MVDGFLSIFVRNLTASLAKALGFTFAPFTNFAASGSTKFWQTIQETPPDLHHLEDILADLLLKDKAPSTRKAYLAAFHKWTHWANHMGLPAFPAQPAHIA